MPQDACGGLQNNLQELVISFSMWVLGIEIKSAGLEAGAFIH